MTQHELRHVNRQLTPDERQRHAEVRESAMADFPPVATAAVTAPPGIPSQVRKARESRGMTRYGLAKLANLPDGGATVRDIEAGRDVQLSDLQSVADALGLKIELVEVSG